MGIIADLCGVEKRTTIADVDAFLDWLGAGSKSSAGVKVNEKEGMKHAPVWMCVKVIAETIASLPLIVYRKTSEKARERAPYHWLYPILHDQPNPEMTAFNYRETTLAHLLLWGNHYSFKERNQRGILKGLWPLQPNKMKIERKRTHAPLTYVYTFLRNGSEIEIEYGPEDIWHLRGLGNDGLVGYSPIKQMAEAVGFGIATQKFGAAFFRNSSRPSGILKSQKTLDPKTKKRLQYSWERMQQGEENWHRTAVLEEGMEWQQLGIPPEDAQFLDSRKFSRSEIAGIYRVPPHMIGDLERATFSNIEHQAIEFVVHCIGPWLKRIEMSANIFLLGPKEKNRYYTEHLLDALLRGDTKTRHEVYGMGRQWGYYSPNDIMRMENMNPIPANKGGDTYVIPMNMIPQTGSVQTQPVQWRKIAQQRSVSNRKHLKRNFFPVFESAGRRIVNKEVKAVKNAVERFVTKRNKEDFQKWLNEFYGKLPKDIEENMMPVLISYGGAVQEEAANEVGAKVGMSTELEDFLAGYGHVFQRRHIGSSRGQIGDLVEQTPEEDLTDAINQRMDEWREKRAGKIARRETVEAMGAVVKWTFAGAGVARLVWAAGADACPYCKELDGRVVGIEQNFVGIDEEFEPEGVEVPMKIRKPTSHPPLHDGCECDILAE